MQLGIKAKTRVARQYFPWCWRRRYLSFLFIAMSLIWILKQNWRWRWRGCLFLLPPFWRAAESFLWALLWETIVASVFLSFEFLAHYSVRVPRSRTKDFFFSGGLLCEIVCESSTVFGVRNDDVALISFEVVSGDDEDDQEAGKILCSRIPSDRIHFTRESN